MGIKYGKQAVDTAIAVLRRTVAETFAGYIESAEKPDDIDGELDILNDMLAKIQTVHSYVRNQKTE